MDTSMCSLSMAPIIGGTPSSLQQRNAGGNSSSNRGYNRKVF